MKVTGDIEVVEFVKRYVGAPASIPVDHDIEIQEWAVCRWRRQQDGRVSGRKESMCLPAIIQSASTILCRTCVRDKTASTMNGSGQPNRAILDCQLVLIICLCRTSYALIMICIPSYAVLAFLLPLRRMQALGTDGPRPSQDRTVHTIITSLTMVSTYSRFLSALDPFTQEHS